MLLHEDRWLPWLLLLSAAVSGLRFAPVVERMLEGGDFPEHIRYAQRLFESGQWLPHFGYHLFVIAVHQALPGTSWPSAAMTVTMAGTIATAVILAWWIARATPSRAARLVLLALLPAALLTAQPLLVPGPFERDPWLIGYFPPNQWHSPTTLYSKPVMLVLFALGAAALAGGRAGRGALLGSAALVLLSVAIKPSFLMAFLPALAVAAVVRWRRADWRFVVAGFALPAVLFLAGQYLAYYASGASGNALRYAPLFAIGVFSPIDAATLSWKLIASIAFPAAVILCFPAALRDVRLSLAWGTVVVALGWGYLLAEDGRQVDHGNLLWSGQLAVFLLFAVSAVWLVERLAGRPASTGVTVWTRAAICLAALAWHVDSGIRHFQTSWLD
jgi:hypothetical protein